MIVKSHTYAILSPALDQSLTIARLLRTYYPRTYIVGVLQDDDDSGLPSLYDSIVPVSQLTITRTDTTIIPTGAKATRFMLERGNITLGAITLTQPALRVYDKLWMISLAASISVPTPITWRRLSEVVTYPIFYKVSEEWGGGARGVAFSADEVPLEVQDKLLFQELISGQGTYGVSFLADRGQLLAYHSHFEQESIPKEGGSAVIIKHFFDDRLLKYTQRLVEALTYSGWGLAEYKYCPRRKDFIFMEINAKFWASCEFTFRNNPAFLKLLFNIDSKEVPCQTMVFVERAFMRGLPFVISHFPEFLNSDTLYGHPGWMRRIIAQMLPSSLRQYVRRLKSRALPDATSIK